MRESFFYFIKIKNFYVFNIVENLRNIRKNWTITFPEKCDRLYFKVRSNKSTKVYFPSHSMNIDF